MTAISIFSPAKINLFLHVIGRRADGYHTLESLVAFASIGDQLSFTPSDQFSVQLDGTFAASLSHCTFEKLSIVQAAKLLASHTHHPLNGEIILGKELPVAAGIGGGSSNAAATLIGLNQLWQTNVSLDELATIGLRIGADVPMCLYQQTALVKGIGEEITPMDISLPYGLILINPNIEVATPEVFKQFREMDISFTPSLDKKKFSTPILDWLSLQHNDLANVACFIQPVIDTVLHSLQNTNSCLLARMSGSGATCFGLYPSPEEAKEKAAILAALYPHWWVRSGYFL